MQSFRVLNNLIFKKTKIRVINDIYRAISLIFEKMLLKLILILHVLKLDFGLKFEKIIVN